MSTEKNPKVVHFKVDGQPHSTTDHHQPAGAVLQSVGVDPGTHDLAEVKPNGQPHTFRDDQIVHIKDGDEFLTVRQQAPVA